MAPKETIADISSRLIVNKAAMRSHHAQVSGLIDRLKEALPSEVCRD
jgi:ATP phosphoribosyltransferase